MKKTRWYGTIENDRMYVNKEVVNGVKSFELGEISRITSEIKGSGINGVVEIPSNSYTQIDLTITCGVLNDETAKLLEKNGVEIVYGATIHVIEKDTNESVEQTIEGSKIIARCNWKSFNPGSYQNGETVEASVTFTVFSVKILDNNHKEILNINKFKTDVESENFLSIL